ncbi:hypothetical protein [Parachlamydia sp. AcF125]|nr:hypothetical protein [Parachlamydia sp. AcF125]MBS4168112.1 hypothetical protein [Parachlamydia sp. AcF125]
MVYYHYSTSYALVALTGIQPLSKVQLRGIEGGTPGFEGIGHLSVFSPP